MDCSTFATLGIEANTAQVNARTICPRCEGAHNNRKKTLSCDTVRGLFQCFRCGWSGRIGGNIGWTDRRPAPTALETQRRKRQYAIDCILRESAPLTDPIAQPARVYLSRGSAIRLSAASDELVLCEGVEIAAALSLMLNAPAWAAISAHGLETVAIPNSVRHIHIGADNDASNTGQRAARRLAHRLWIEGHQDIEIHTPDTIGTDWADEIRTQNNGR